MRIGDMVSMMMMMSTNMDRFTKQAEQAQLQLSTGKRINSASDDPSAMLRIQNITSEINENQITQSTLNDATDYNKTMENSLDSLNTSAQSLATLAVQLSSPGADTASIQTQATQILDSMASQMANTSYNGINPFSNGTQNYRETGGGTISVTPPKFNITKDATSGYDITLNDGTVLSQQSVSSILNSTYIQTNLTSQISDANGSLGTSDTILSTRLTFEQSQATNLNNELSNLQDVDVTQATAELTKDKAMASLNQSLINAYNTSMTSQISSLFNALA